MLRFMMVLMKKYFI